jgi:putative ABC transport system substrate-binding protein
MLRWLFVVILAWSLAALAQAQATAVSYRMAFPADVPVEVAERSLASQAMVGRMIELGYLPGRNLQFDIRSTDGRRERAPQVAAELVALRPDLIVVPTCGHLLDSLRKATRTIPILVAACTDDMVAAGIVASLARPGGNVTGQQKLTPELSAKRLELLKDIVPRATRVAVLWDPDYSSFDADWRMLRAAARSLGVTLLPVQARTVAQLDAAFSEAADLRADAMLTLSDPMTFDHAARVAELAAQYRLPLVAPYRQTADAGGLVAYGPNVLAMVRRAAEMADRILKGAKPADMPVEQPAKFDLVVNLKTARALGLTLPQSLLLRADEVIQ